AGHAASRRYPGSASSVVVTSPFHQQSGLRVMRQPWKAPSFCDYNSRVRARIVLPVTFIAALLISARSQPGVSNSVASGDGPCRPQIAADGRGPAPHNGIVMNGIDGLEQDGFREIRGSN